MDREAVAQVVAVPRTVVPLALRQVVAASSFWEPMKTMTGSDSYIFVHIPKTAGLSIRKLFEATFGPENVSQPFVVSKIDDRERDRLQQYRMISGHISEIDVRQFPDRQLITFLRDPIDRCLSIYSFYRNHTGQPLIALSDITNTNRSDEAISLARQLDPNDFFECNHPHVVQNLHNRMVWQLGIHADYSYRATANDEDAFREALANIARYYFVGFFEELAEDVRRLQSRWDGAGEVGLPSLNRTSNRLQRSDLSEKTITT